MPFSFGLFDLAEELQTLLTVFGGFSRQSVTFPKVWPKIPKKLKFSRRLWRTAHGTEVSPWRGAWHRGGFLRPYSKAPGGNDRQLFLTYLEYNSFIHPPRYRQSYSSSPAD